MDLILAKILTAILLFVLTMIFSLIPYFFVSRGSTSAAAVQRRQWILGHLNCFAGGVFLATLLCHILPEGGESFDDWKDKAHKDWDFPLFNIFVAIGFFIVAFVEFFAAKHMRNETEVAQPPAQPTSEDAAVLLQGDVHNGGYGATDNHNGQADQPNQNHNSSSQNTEHTHNHAHTSETDGGHNHASKPEGLRAFLLLIALSFHTIFDGLAVGLQDDDSEVWLVFGAITIHKSVIAFCIGLEIFQSSRNKFINALIWLLIFAIMSPVGIGVGIWVTSGSTDELARLLISSILQGMAAGTFMYVTFLEILCLHIGHHGQGNIFHIIWALIGFSAMAATKLLDRD